MFNLSIKLEKILSFIKKEFLHKINPYDSLFLYLKKASDLFHHIYRVHIVRAVKT